MFEKDNYSPFLHSKGSPKDISDELLQNPIQQYNYVIHHYNIKENQVDGKYLDQVRESHTYHYFWRVFSHPWAMFIVLSLIMTPGLGCFFYVWLVSAILVYLRALSVFNRNESKVSDPFENMVFSPELCRATSTSNKFYEVRVEDLEEFSFNPEVVAKLKQTQDQDEVKFMVYNGRFWDYYHNLSKFKARFILLWITASALLVVQAYFIKTMLEDRWNIV